MSISAIDQYLADGVTRILDGKGVPPWPFDLIVDAQAAAQRIAFHGIALILAEAQGALADWPPALAHAVREQAGIQAFWETGHRSAIAPLLEALAAAGIPALVTKGTALAYSVYRNPAQRRRGDTDVYLPGADRRRVRAVLRTCGFRPAGDTKALQESWVCGSVIGFEPAVDIHWRINASAAVSALLESGLRFDASIALDRLAPRARGIGPVDNLILAAINRSAHGQFGYHVGTERLFESDRLIWAVDMRLLSVAFTSTEWQALAERAAQTGTAAIVADALAFSARALGTKVPSDCLATLAAAPADHGLSAYFGASSHLWRLRQDLAACASLSESARVLRYVLLPSTDFLRDHFPDAQGWPPAALHLRRWAVGAGKLLAGRS